MSSRNFGTSNMADPYRRHFREEDIFGPSRRQSYNERPRYQSHFTDSWTDDCYEESTRGERRRAYDFGEINDVIEELRDEEYHSHSRQPRRPKANTAYSGDLPPERERGFYRSRQTQDQLPRRNTDFPRTEGARRSGFRRRSPSPAPRRYLPRRNTDFPGTEGTRRSGFRYRSPSPVPRRYRHHSPSVSPYPHQRRSRRPSSCWSSASENRNYSDISSDNPSSFSSKPQPRQSWGRQSKQPEAAAPVEKARYLYDVLGLQRGCSEDDIKKAYRKLSLKHHPDKNPGDATATAKFQEMSEAYETLRDPKQRVEYDSGGSENGNIFASPKNYREEDPPRRHRPRHRHS